MNQATGDFNDLLIESISQGLGTVLGYQGAKTVTFYIDPHIAVADPDLYAESVKKLLGTGTEILFNVIFENLHRKTDTPKGDAKSFGDVVSAARRNFQRSSRLRSD